MGEEPKRREAISQRLVLPSSVASIRKLARSPGAPSPYPLPEGRGEANAAAPASLLPSGEKVAQGAG